MTFDWNLLITALTGLGGVAVGGFVTWKIQERQLKHIDENRFQEQRMDSYVKLLTAAYELSAYMVVREEYKNKNPGYKEPEHDIERSEKLEKFINEVQFLRIASTKETLDKIKIIHDALIDYLSNKISAGKYSEMLNTSVEDFVSAARKELKIEE